jgi:hypothetical protein
MFVVGVALFARNLFGDTTLHIADPTIALRLTNVRTALVGPGDSIRVFATRTNRDGQTWQPVLDRGSIFPLATDAQLPFHATTTAQAASAAGGQLDAALVRVTNALVEDTATVPTNIRRLRVNDGSGQLEVYLDSIVGFTSLVLPPDTVGARLDILGVLVPTGPTSWRLKPRGPSDVAPR